MNKLVQHYWFGVWVVSGMFAGVWTVIMLGQLWYDKPYQDARNTGAIWMVSFLISMGKYVESRKNGH